MCQERLGDRKQNPQYTTVMFHVPYVHLEHKQLVVKETHCPCSGACLVIYSQTIVSQITESGPVYSFSQEHGASILKGCTSEPAQPKVTHVHVQFTDTQGHSEQEFQESVPGHTEQCDNRSQESVQEHRE